MNLKIEGEKYSTVKQNKVRNKQKQKSPIVWDRKDGISVRLKKDQKKLFQDLSLRNN